MPMNILSDIGCQTILERLIDRLAGDQALFSNLDLIGHNGFINFQ